MLVGSRRLGAGSRQSRRGRSLCTGTQEPRVPRKRLQQTHAPPHPGKPQAAPNRTGNREEDEPIILRNTRATRRPACIRVCSDLARRAKRRTVDPATTHWRATNTAGNAIPRQCMLLLARCDREPLDSPQRKVLRPLGAQVRYCVQQRHIGAPHARVGYLREEGHDGQEHDRHDYGVHVAESEYEGQDGRRRARGGCRGRRSVGASGGGGGGSTCSLRSVQEAVYDP